MTMRLFAGLRGLLLTALFLAVVVATVSASAPGPRLSKIGLLTPSTPAAAATYVEAFRQGLRELGHVEGTTILVEIRYGEGKFERLPELARELVGLKPDVIVVATDPGIAAVRRETRTIPIVMAVSTDPVSTGFVTSLAHPGGSVTGLSNISP
jgi:putative tryptophan/tyrosine transport system substrate-binding protein